MGNNTPSQSPSPLPRFVWPRPGSDQPRLAWPEFLRVVALQLQRDYPCSGPSTDPGDFAGELPGGAPDRAIGTGNRASSLGPGIPRCPSPRGRGHQRGLANGARGGDREPRHLGHHNTGRESRRCPARVLLSRHGRRDVHQLTRRALLPDTWSGRKHTSPRPRTRITDDGHREMHRVVARIRKTSGRWTPMTRPTGSPDSWRTGSISTTNSTRSITCD